MSITVEKIESKEDLLRLIDRLSGGEGSKHRTALQEAKAKMEAAGFSANAMAGLAQFAAHVDDFVSALATAMTLAERTHSRDAEEFTLATFKWIAAGLDNTHAMLEKAGVDSDVFNLRSRSEGFPEFLQVKTRQFRDGVRKHIEYTLTDEKGSVTKLMGVTEGEAAIEALDKLGYTLAIMRK